MNTNERKPVVVIYDDENVLESLTQELINAAVKALLAGEFECEQMGTIKYFKSEDACVRMNYGDYIGLEVSLKEKVAVTDNIRDYMQGADKAAKKKELEMLKKRVGQLESELK